MYQQGKLKYVLEISYRWEKCIEKLLGSVAPLFGLQQIREFVATLKIQSAVASPQSAATLQSFPGIISLHA